MVYELFSRASGKTYQVEERRIELYTARRVYYQGRLIISQLDPVDAESCDSASLKIGDTIED